MSNLNEVLGLATKLGNFMFPDVSANRPRAEQGSSDLEAYAASIKSTQNKFALDQFRNGSGGTSRKDLIAYGHNVMNRGNLGNCVEIACAGAATLELGGIHNWRLVKYKAPYDHVFLALGDTGQLDADFAKWDDECAIFDGWGQIACLAINYKVKWIAKMDAWTNSKRYKVKLPDPKGISTLYRDANRWNDVVNMPKEYYDT